MREPRSAAPAVLRRHPRAHGVLVRRAGARARSPARATPIASRAARRSAIQPYDAEGKPQRRIQLRRPLDFAVVTDHSELLGETQICQDPALPATTRSCARVVRRFPKLGYALVNGPMLQPRACRSAIRSAATDGARLPRGRRARRGARSRTPPRTLLRPQRRVPLHDVRRLRVDRHARGRQPPPQRRSSATRRCRRYPTTYIETPTPEGLWRALERECLERRQRLRRARDPAQLERVRRAHVHGDALRRRAAHAADAARRARGSRRSSR